MLTDIARNEWGFTGYIVSDGGAIHGIQNSVSNSTKMPCWYDIAIHFAHVQNIHLTDDIWCYTSVLFYIYVYWNTRIDVLIVVLWSHSILNTATVLQSPYIVSKHIFQAGCTWQAKICIQFFSKGCSRNCCAGLEGKHY